MSWRTKYRITPAFIDGFIDGYLRINLFLLPVALVENYDIVTRALFATALLLAAACREKRIEQLESYFAEAESVIDELFLADLRSQHQSLQDSLASGFLSDEDRRTVYQGMRELSERIAALEGTLRHEEGEWPTTRE